MTVKDALEILELEDAFDAREMLKTQYRWLVKFYHPDNPCTGDPEEFKKVVEAYRVLMSYWL
jgi:curved DNA-binding protein CbpA